MAKGRQEPGCSVPISFRVLGTAADAVAEAAAAAESSIPPTGGQLPSLDEVAINVGSLRPGWHYAEARAFAPRPPPPPSSGPPRGHRRGDENDATAAWEGGSALAAAEATAFRVVYLEDRPDQEAVDLGFRGSVRFVPMPPQPTARGRTRGAAPAGMVAVCRHGGGGGDGQDADGNEGFDSEVVIQNEESLYPSAVQIAEGYGLGRIEAMELYSILDRALRRVLISSGNVPTPPPMPPRRFAVISADTNAEYAFYLPIVALTWARVIGYQPLVFLVGAAWRNPGSGTRRGAVLDGLRSAGALVQILDSGGLNTAAMAQVSRLYACIADGLTDDDFLLTSDADLLPLDEEHFGVKRNWDRQLHLYNSFCCGPLLLPDPVSADDGGDENDGGVGVSSLAAAGTRVAEVSLGAPALVEGAGVKDDHRLLHLPVSTMVSYAGARVGLWRELMGLSRAEEEALRRAGMDDLLSKAVQHRLIHDLGEERAKAIEDEDAGGGAPVDKHADLDMWHLDQRLLSAKVGSWRGFPMRAELVPRRAHLDRVDRARWRLPASLDGFVDAHMPQPGFDPRYWLPAVRPLLAMLLGARSDGPELLEVIDEFKSAYDACEQD